MRLSELDDLERSLATHGEPRYLWQSQPTVNGTAAALLPKFITAVRAARRHVIARSLNRFEDARAAYKDLESALAALDDNGES